jgi:hypothetical protein
MPAWKALALSVTDTNSAQERSLHIDELVSRYFLEWRRSSFPLIAQHMRLTMQEVETEVRIVVLPRPSPSKQTSSPSKITSEVGNESLPSSQVVRQVRNGC